MATPAFIPRYKKVADLVRKRILHGDYALKPIPSERTLAGEMGVNYMTVRRGLQILENENLVVRQPNGRMRVKRARQGGKRHLSFAFLAPTFRSDNVEMWRQAIEKAAAKLACRVRPILYMHWDDPILLDALAGFDGVFLNPIPEPLPAQVAEKLRHPGHPLVVVDDDFSGYGIPSIQFFPPAFVRCLLDHLNSLGHTRIGCINAQPSNSEIQGRIGQWRHWMAARGFTGRLEDSPVPVRAHPGPHAYDVMTRILSEPVREETAWLCTTTPTAMGAMRAILDKGLVPGRDIAVCATNGESLAALLNPSLTALEPVDPTPFFSRCLKWMLGGRPWQGPLLVRPKDIPLVIRESTGPNPEKRREVGASQLIGVRRGKSAGSAIPPVRMSEITL
ncbi:MAG: substrate-binding domain-containing protein [Terrimicrobiaceae bacterium]